MTDTLLALTAARRGHFRLESGHHGDLWLDLDRLFVRPAGVRLPAEHLAARLAGYRAAAICGPLLGGALLAQMIAATLGAEFYYLERDPQPRPGALYPVAYRLPAGLRPRLRGLDVAVVDDAINAGSAVRATLAELDSAGARPVAVGALLVLGSCTPADLDLDLPFQALQRLPAGLWLPSDCPLCSAGVPLETPAAPGAGEQPDRITGR